MLEIESRQVRRARERHEASPAKYTTQKPAGNRATRRAQRPDDNEIIIRPTSMNAMASLRRARRDYRIRHKLRPARGMVQPKMISMRRLVLQRIMVMIFAYAAKRAEIRREVASQVAAAVA
jgi:hypothetical protein